MTVRVLVVEDEELAAEAHATYVGRIAGFEVAAVARSLAEAVRALEADREIGLVLLDMNLPDGHGLALLQRLRAAGWMTDVMAVTSARDAEVVRRSVAHGVVAYLIKPFTFPMFRARLEQYAEYRAGLARRSDEPIAQDDVDALLGTLRRGGAATALPKGMSAESMRQVTDVLRDAAAAMSATEVAERIGSSRVTARRYLEHLADVGNATRATRYGRSGRPEVEYRWR